MAWRPPEDFAAYGRLKQLSLFLIWSSYLCCFLMVEEELRRPLTMTVETHLWFTA